MTVLFSDSLNRTANATSLGTSDSYAGGTNKAWIVLGSAVYGIDANGYAYCSTKATSGHGVAYADTGNADGSITETIRNVTGDYPKLAFRITDGENFLFVEHQIDANQLQLRKYVGGSGTTIATKASAGLTASDIIKITCNGTAITVYLNGVQVITATDATNQTATKWGFNSYNYTNARLDNIIVEDLNTGGTGATVTGIAATATADTIAPTVTSQKQANISSVIASITADALAPTITTASSTSASITALSATVTGDALNPSLSAGNTITSVLASVVGDALNPSISIGSNIQNVMGTSIADALSPQVGSFTNISINAVIVSVTADAISPAVDTIRNISIPSILADAAAEALTPNVLARSSSVQIVSVITEALAETLTPSFFQLWREVSLTTVPFTEMSPSIDTAWRDPERTVNYFK